MAVSAYILIQTEVGKAADVADEVRTIAGVLEADDVTGPYDVVVRVEAETMDDLGKMVVSRASVAGAASTRARTLHRDAIAHRRLTPNRAS